MKYIKIIFTTLLIGLLTACSKDSAENQSDASVRMLRATRSSLLGTETYGDIRVFLTGEDNPIEGLFKYVGGSQWNTQMKLKSGEQTYRLYGYMPDDGIITKSLTDWNDNSGVLHLGQLDPMSDKDYCIVTGVRQVDNDEDERTASRGAFVFTYNSSRENYINLLFDHLYARVVFSMNVTANYSSLRTIKIKKMRLELSGVSKFSADVTLADGIGISSVVYTPTGTSSNVKTIMEGEQTLTTTFMDVASIQLIPYSAMLSGLHLITEYDVYDRQGNKVAERTATNKLEVPLDELQREEERTLLITVDPSYLYVLSEQDPPLVIIRK